MERPKPLPVRIDDSRSVKDGTRKSARPLPFPPAISLFMTGALTLFLFAGIPRAMAQDDVRLELEKKAEFWAQNGREDLAAQTYRQLLFLYPNSRHALIGLTEASILTGHKKEADGYIKRLRILDPRDPSLPFFSREMALGPRWTQAIMTARTEDSHHHYGKAFRAFKDAFGPLPPPPDFAVEYYHVLLRLKGGPQTAERELESLTRQYPGSLHYRLAYGEILSYREGKRHAAIRILKPLALTPSPVSHRAKLAWKRTLVWEGDNPSFVPELSEYLRSYRDPGLEELLARARQRVLQEGHRPVQAYAALHRGKFRDARDRFTGLLKEDPGNGSYWIGLSSAWFGMHRFGKAKEALDQAKRSRLSPRDQRRIRILSRKITFWSLMKQGHEALERGDAPHAYSLYRRAYRIDPDNISVLDVLSGLELERGHPDRSLSLARRALRLHPHDSNAWSGVLNALVAGKRYPEALAFLEASKTRRIREIEKRDPSFLLVEGTIYAHTHHPGKSDRRFKKAEVAIPDPTPSQELSLAWGFYTLGQSQSLSRILDSLHAEPGLTAKEQDQVVQLEHLKTLLDVNGDLVKKEYRMAHIRLSSAIRRFPGDRFYPREDAAVSMASGQFEDAFRTEMSLGPGHTIDTYEQAILSAIRAHHLGKASDWTADARRRWPDRPRVIVMEARLMEAQGHDSQARRLLEDALRDTPNDPRLFLGLTEIDMEENRLSDARKNALLALDQSRNAVDEKIRTQTALEAQSALDAISRRERQMNASHFEFLLGETVFTQYTQYYYSQIGGFFPIGTTAGGDGVSSTIYLHAFIEATAFTFQYHPSASASSLLSQTYFGGTPAVGVRIPTFFGSWEGDVGWGIAQHDQTLSPPGTVTGLFLQTDLLLNLMGGGLDLFANYTGYINYIYFQSRYLHPAWASSGKTLAFGLGPEAIVQGNENYSAYMGGAAFQLFVAPLRSTLLLDTGILGSSAYPGVGGYEGFSWYFYY